MSPFIEAVKNSPLMIEKVVASKFPALHKLTNALVAKELFTHIREINDTKLHSYTVEEATEMVRYVAYRYWYEMMAWHLADNPEDLERVNNLRTRQDYLQECDEWRYGSICVACDCGTLEGGDIQEMYFNKEQEKFFGRC